MKETKGTDPSYETKGTDPSYETKGTDPSDCAGGYEGDRPFGLRRSHEIILRQI